MPSVSHDVTMGEIFHEDPAYALYLLQGVLSDGEPAELLIVLRQLRLAFKGVRELTEAQAATVIALYRNPAARGAESLNTLMATLKAIGLGLALAPLDEEGAVEAVEECSVDEVRVA